MGSLVVVEGAKAVEGTLLGGEGSVWMPQEAKGTPLSVRIDRASPKLRKMRSKTGRAPWPLMFGSPRQASR